MSSHQALLNELGLEGSVDAHISKLLDDDEARFGKPLPRVLRDMYETPGLLGLLDNWFSNRFERPGALRTYPHQPSPLVSRPLWLASENQGVGHWVVPMDGSDDPPVYVTGDLRSGRSVARYADSLAEFFGAVAWDVTGVAGPDDVPIIQAQADPLDSVSIAFLEQRFVQRSTTHGWPCRDNRRFQRDDQRIALWSCDDQCDWWLVAQSPASLHRLVRDVIHLSDLKESLWSNDATGMAILSRVRSELS